MLFTELFEGKDACPVCGQTPCNCTHIAEGLRDPEDNPCWKGYHPVGTKQKNGKTVPNCVPKEGVEEGQLDEISADPRYLSAAERSRSAARDTQRQYWRSPEEKAAARQTELKRDKGIAGYSKRHRAANPDMYPKVTPKPAPKLRDPSTEYSDDYSVWAAGRRDTMEQGVAEAMTPQQQHDFDRMRAGAMSRKAYDAKWKKPRKSDDEVIYGKKKGVAEGISVVDQDYDLDQIILTLDIEGKRVYFTYTDYEEDFENAERRDVFDQLQEQPWYKGLDHPTKMEILDAAYRAIRGLEPQEYRPTVSDEPLDEQGVAEGVTPASVSKVLRLIDRHHPEWFDNYGMGEVEDTVVDLADMGQFSGMSAADALELVGQELESLYGQQGVAEGYDKWGWHTSLTNGEFMPTKYGNKAYVYLHDLDNESPRGGPQLVTVNKPTVARRIAQQFGGKVVKTDLNTYRIVKPAEQGVAEGPEERSQNRLWQMITDYEQRAKATKNDIKRNHYLKMASELRGKLKTSDNEQGVAEGNKKPEPPEADYGDEYQAMVARVKKLAGLGPLKTVWDPQKRVYKNVPVAQQPGDKK